MLKVLMAHNLYLQPGGEDEVVAAESALLREHGHEVVEYTDDNHRIESLGAIQVAAGTLWSRSSKRRIAALIKQSAPDVVHFHNTFPLISPAAYYACWEAGVPVVQTLHNYRLLCPNALFLRDGLPCELCLGRTPPWPSVVYGCYRGSRTQSAVVAGMLTLHRFLGTWQRKIDRFIVLTEFCRKIFIRSHLPAEKLVVKPNFFHPDPGPGDGRDGFVLFVGRLSHEKGIETLLAAWERHVRGGALKIAGDGPLAPQVAGAAERSPSIEWLGRRSKGELMALMRRAAILVVPSRLYEGFPVVLAEAFSASLPVIVSAHGSLAEIVEDRETGLHFRPDDSQDLATKLDELLTHPDLLNGLRRKARAEYESQYGAERNYSLLLGIYQQALALRMRKVAAS